MFTASVYDARVQCPSCRATLTDWSARCPRCRYHPDCDDRDCYNRAQDDVALLLRLDAAPRSRPAVSDGRGPAGCDHSWRRFLPAPLRRLGVSAN